MEEYWELLESNRQRTSERRIEDLFEEDQHRFQDFSIITEDLILDYSKTNIDKDAKTNLVNLASFGSIQNKVHDMFSGKEINNTENRSVLHTALRNFTNPLVVNGVDINLIVNQSLEKISSFTEGIRCGKITANSGDAFTDVVNIGIGGSELGPKLVTRALYPYHDGPKIHFVSNLDSADLTDTMSQLDPKSTLIIVSSKSFTTLETLTNAKTIKKWILSELGPSGMNHFVAVCCAKDKALEFGITEDQIFEFKDWVGGRFSVWGPIGMPVMLAVGISTFRKFLEGASSIDRQFQNSEIPENLPIMLALIGIWHASICQYPSKAILPYEHRLEYLPMYLQQLDMESNGKSVNRDGEFIAMQSTPISWGQTGTNGQHAFYQFLHQSNQIVPCEFILGANCFEQDLRIDHHEGLIANCLAQSEALMFGIDPVKHFESRELANNSEERKHTKITNAHLFCAGNRPSTTLLYSKLTPEILGKMLALFEHRTFVEGLIWNLNSFDQWGVELGKGLARELSGSIKGNEDLTTFSSSTLGLVREIKRLKN